MLINYAVLCCAVLCCAVLCCAVLCCAVLCCAVLGRAGLAMLRAVVLPLAALRCTAPSRTFRAALRCGVRCCSTRQLVWRARNCQMGPSAGTSPRRTALWVRVCVLSQSWTRRLNTDKDMGVPFCPPFGVQRRDVQWPVKVPCWSCCTACAPWQLSVVKHRCTIPRCTHPTSP